jgi:hypothetical protein
MQTTGISFLLGAYQGAVTNALEKMRRANIAARIWANDYRVWKSSPAEISNRLGWLHAPVETASNAGRIRASLETFTSGAIDDVVLLGMGGSSLSAEVFNAMLGSAPGFPRLQILDTTDPAVIGRTARMLNLEKTLFIVSSKSGKTLEILSLFLYFYNLADAAPGVAANEHFMFITDEGSPMLAQAWQLQLPYVFSNNPNIGGRYAALSLVGMIPAALMGISIETLLQNAMAVAGREKTDFFSGKGDSTGLLLGAALGTLAQYGRDKLTLVFPPAWRPFGDRLEQLIAESLGKEGKGIVPVLNEPPLETQVYGKDRIFVFFEDDPGRWFHARRSWQPPGIPVDSAGRRCLRSGRTDVFMGNGHGRCGPPDGRESIRSAGCRSDQGTHQPDDRLVPENPRPARCRAESRRCRRRRLRRGDRIGPRLCFAEFSGAGTGRRLCRSPGLSQPLARARRRSGRLRAALTRRCNGCHGGLRSPLSAFDRPAAQGRRGPRFVCSVDRRRRRGSAHS